MISTRSGFVRPPAAAVGPLLVCLAAVFPAALAAQTASFGPLAFEEQAPLQRISYTHAVEGADLVPTGALQADFWLGYSNIFEQDSAATHVLFFDLERLVSAMGVRYGVSEAIEIGGRVSWETSGGGILDGFISGWHETLGVGNANRELYPNGAYAQRLEGRRGTLLLDVPPRTFALVDARLSAKWRAWAAGDGRRVLSLRGVVRIPMQENVAGRQRTDLGGMAIGRVSWDRWHLHGTLGGATVRAAPDYRGWLRSSAWFADLSLERNLAPWISGLVQYSVATPRLSGVDHPELDGWPGNVVFGAAGRLGTSWRWDVSFQEDIPATSPSVDFTLGIGLRRTW